MRATLRMIVIVLTIYVGSCLALYLFQRSLIYRPQPASFNSVRDMLEISVAGETLVLTAHRHKGRSALLYFGGNGEDVSESLSAFVTAFRDHAIYLLHYPGYGRSSGSPSEELIQAAALAAFDKIHEDHEIVDVVGRSLGSGVATHLASERPVHRLILVTPYDSLAEIAASRFPYFPVRWMIEDRFESSRYAQIVRAPTLLLEAENDEIIPPENTERLFDAFAKGVATRTVIPMSGHNTISDSPRYLEAIQSALNGGSE